ncbi:potassium voltage-gated channel subfamily E member 3 [Nothoprocta perdicaria]|uniref:Potassium voltage-gated channel subfamily E regulatory subunit 3 n=2 Tax=Nothoprocta TaxID=8806 RepID=A0A8C6ZL59_NOTPE|nr:potassium voltage-gated channel subfamily E member 3 [Nothoprocta perdicaria]
MDAGNGTGWPAGLHAVLRALNHTLCGGGGAGGERAVAAVATGTTRSPAPARGARGARHDNAYMYVLFVMTLFAATVGSLILGYTRSRRVDKRSDPYHVYIKNRVSMI